MIIKTKINPIKCDCNKFEIKSMSFVSCFDYQINWLIINDNDLAFSNDINLLMFRYVCCFKFTVINEWMKSAEICYDQNCDQIFCDQYEWGFDVSNGFNLFLLTNAIKLNICYNLLRI